MAGQSSGIPDPDTYNLGRGALFFAPLNATGEPEGYRHLGNCPSFSVTIDTETLEHQSSLEGLKTVDKEVTLSQTLSVSLSLDEINFDNLAIFMSGTANDSEYSTPTTITTEDVSGGTPASGTALATDKWYDILDSTGKRVYDIATGANVDVFLASTELNDDGTDYDLDLVMGRVYLKAAANPAADENLNVTITTNSATAINQVEALNSSSVAGALKFVGKNPANADEQTEYQFHKIALKSEGEFALISDDWTVMQFTGKAEKEANSGKTLTISSFTQA